MERQRIDDRIDYMGGNAGTGHIMDQDQIGLSRKRVKACKDRLAARRPARRNRKFAARGARPISRVAVGRHHQHDHIDQGMGIEGVERVLRDGFAADLAPLLGHPAACAQAFTRRDDQRGDLWARMCGPNFHAWVIFSGRARHNGAQ